MLAWLLIILVIAVLAVLIYVGMQPSTSIISREIPIQASPEVLFPYINNSKLMNDWMPWKESDPKLVMHYSGPDEGVGAQSHWDSPGKMGKGQAVIIESIPNQSVKTQLTYVRPREMNQIAEMSLIPSSNGTTVRWTVTGNNGFVGRLFFLLINCEKMVGDSFIKGLNNLKTTVETQQK